MKSTWNEQKLNAVLAGDRHTSDVMKSIDRAFEIQDRAKRWKSVIAIYLEQVPGLAEVRDGNILLAKQKREQAGLHNRRMKASETMTMGLVMPPAYLNIIATCDPDFDEVMNDSNASREAQKKVMKLLHRAFPEFSVPLDKD